MIDILIRFGVFAIAAAPLGVAAALLVGWLRERSRHRRVMAELASLDELLETDPEAAMREIIDRVRARRGGR